MSHSNLKYISTRLVVSKSKSAFQEAAKKAMKANGYVIIALEGWIVKKFADGRIEKIEELENPNQNNLLILD
jgi:hypothetical protein